MLKKILYILLVLILLGALGFVSYKYYLLQKVVSPKTSEQQKSGPPEQVKEITKKDIDASKAPDRFPVDVPIEAGAKITQNYNAQAPDGRYQATRVFETNKTLDENFKIYQDYLKQKDWEIKSTENKENYKMLFGSKTGQQLQISIDYNKDFKISTVSLTYTQAR